MQEMTNKRDIVARLPSMSDEEATLRLKNYNPDGTFGRALTYAWMMAGPIIIDTHHQVSMEMVRRAQVTTSREELLRHQMDTILKDGLQSVHDRFKLPLDIEWIRRVAASAVVLHGQSIQTASLVKGKTEITKRTAIRIHDEFSDSEIAIQVANTLWSLLAFETEILVWQIGELQRSA